MLNDGLGIAALIVAALVALIAPRASAQVAESNATPLAGTSELTVEGDLAAQMVAGIGAYLDGALAKSVERRRALWNPDFTSAAAYAESVAPNRQRFARIIGAVDERLAPAMEQVTPFGGDAVLATGEGYRVVAVRWPVLRGVNGEGVLLEPASPVANIVVLPDCDWTPEMLCGLEPGIPVECQFARRLAEAGCRVLVPVLISRADTWSGHPDVRMTNQPHREFVYRPAYEMGRHVIGYEVQKVLAAVDWFTSREEELPIGVAGYGEGGLVAFYSAALDPRIQSVLVSGHFRARESVWTEPIYRNVWALLHEFGDAEIASLIAPRQLVVEASDHPDVSGPPPRREGRSGAAPGAITTPAFEEVEREVQRARSLVQDLKDAPEIALIRPENGNFGTEAALKAFLSGLGPLALPREMKQPPAVSASVDTQARMKRQFDELVEHTQYILRCSPDTRAAFWARADLSSLDAWQRTAQEYRDYFWEEVIGKLPAATEPPNARSRLVYDQPAYLGYEAMLDVYPNVFAYGILLLPKNLAAGERRPVVVCQHGLEGRPQKAAEPGFDDPAYNQFGCRLAEQGFIVFAPQNPYIGEDAFRVLQRKANPLKLSLFSFIVRQHERILEWLGQQPFVDPARIAFYGISYGGKTAMRVPSLLPGYCLSICSADFNEWISKNTLTNSKYSYVFTGEYEMFEFDLGNTFNYSELSGLILPRPFMVERGHHDGVAPDEWVGYEYARTKRFYDLLGAGDQTTIEFFNGPHCIHGVGTFEFLHKHLAF